MSKNPPKNTLSKGYKMATCRPSHCAGRFQDIHDIGGGKDHNGIHFRNLAAANQGSISRHEVSSCEHRYPDLTPHIVVYSNMWYILKYEYRYMSTCLKYESSTFKKQVSHNFRRGWFEVPDAIQWLESSFDLDAAPPADTAVQRWSLFGSCMRPTAVEEEEMEVVFSWGRSFSSNVGGLETNHACNNIFSRFPW